MAGTLTVVGDSPPVVEVGFEYGLTTGYGSSKTITGTFAAGYNCILTLTGLDPACVFHYRFMAKDSFGLWGYGSDKMFSTTGSASIYEYYNTGGDGDSAAVYGQNWTAMQFTTGATAHTVTDVIAYLERVLNPGTVTLSIRHADGSHFPTGLDICSATLDGDDFSTAYLAQQFAVFETSLDASSEYAIVIRAVAGDAANYVLWQKDTGGGLANAVGCHSTDGGVTWVTDSPTDYLFEIWGFPCVRIASAIVFQDYIQDGDLLFACEYVNLYPPYYPSYNPQLYFQLQVMDTAGTTVLASTPLMDWGMKPGAIYLNASEATGFTLGAAYYIRIYGAGTYATYQLQSTDWIGNSEVYLDQWVILTAHDMETYYNEVYTVAQSGKTLLNDEGGVYFAAGISYLVKVRGNNLFENVAPGVSYTPDSGTIPPTDWSTLVGPDATALLNYFGGWFGVGGKVMGFVAIMGIYVAISMLIIGIGQNKQSVVGALALGIPFVLFGGWLGFVDTAMIAVILAVLMLLLVFTFWISRS